MAAGRVRGPLAARPGRGPPPAPGHARPRARRMAGCAHRHADPAVPPVSAARADRGWDRAGALRRRVGHGDPRVHGPVPQCRRGPAPARRAHLPEAVPRPRTPDRGHRRRDRPVHAAARPEGAHQQPDGDRHGRRRRRLVGGAARIARHPAGRRHPQLHRGARRRGAADERRPPVPLPRHRGRRPGRPGRGPDRAGRPPRGQPPDRRHDRDRGRRLRGGRAPGQPDPGRPRPGGARVGNAAHPARGADRRLLDPRAVADHADERDLAGLADAGRRPPVGGCPRRRSPRRT